MSKLIAVTGNSGKTTLCYLLGLRLGGGGHRTALLSTDRNAPSLQLAMTRSRNPEKKSLGKVLSSPIIDERGILQNMITAKNCLNLGTVSYSPDENKSSYPRVLESDARSLIAQLSGVVEYILLDTQTGLNEIDETLLPLCDAELCVTTADVKGVAYRLSHPARAAAAQVLLESHPDNPMEDVLATFPRHPRYRLPYVKAFAGIFNTGTLDDAAPVKGYAKALDELLSLLTKEIST